MKVTVTAQGEQKSFEPLPAGDYDLVLVSVADKKSQAGNQMAILEFQVDGKTRKVKDQIVMIEQVQWKWEQLAAAYGQFADAGQPLEVDTDDFIGKTCRAHLKIEPYRDKDGNEKQTNRIDYYIAKEDGENKDSAPAKSHAAPAPESEPTKDYHPSQDEEEEVPF